MLKISEELIAFLATHTDFTTAMGTRIFPIVAPDQTTFPFATYRINEVANLSCDGTSSAVQLYFWFGQNEYKKAVDFVDKMKPIIEEKQNYEWQDSTVDFIEEGFSFVGIINFKTN
jgi:hypothetical protein